MEGAEAGFAFSSGMAAVFSTFAALLESGDHIISAKNIFGSTHSLLTQFFPKWQIGYSYFEIDAMEGITSLITPNTKLIYAESPTNPGVDILDLERLGAIAKAHDLILVIDNCFASPYLQQPIKFGADLVIHSGTKLMDGQGRVLAGITVGRADLIDKIYRFSRITGPALSPFNAWVLSKSLETLAVRVDRHCENALRVAQFLEEHPKINWVKYPFLPSHPQYALARKQMKAGGCVVALR
jgi:O-succinylhomoserine sulfhydrylase